MKQMNQISPLSLVIGDKNLSSWSLRAWLGAKLSRLEFEEIMIPLDQEETKAGLKKFSPSLRVPCLIHKELKVWDSLAICEYLAELAPDRNLWPKDSHFRALARSYVAEMHSGFENLRAQLSMDIRLRVEIRHLTPGTVSDIHRVLHLWTEALEKSKGPFLFGDFTLADAFYAPVVLRFISYGVKIESPMIEKYLNEIQNQEYVSQWIAAAKVENPKPLVFRGK